MKTTLTIFVATFGCPGMAMAHVGHLGSLAGHDHTIAGIAIGAAIAVGVAQAIRGRKASAKAAKAGKDETEAEDTAQGEEVEA